MSLGKKKRVSSPKGRETRGTTLIHAQKSIFDFCNGKQPLRHFLRKAPEA